MSQIVGGVWTPNYVKTGRGSLATEEVKESWRRAKLYFDSAPVTPAPSRIRGNGRLKYENDQRYRYVAERLGLSRKQAKRRVKNYRAAHKEGRI